MRGASGMKKDSLDRTAVLVLVVLCASWGLQQVTVKVANEGVSPIWQAGVRSIGAAVLLLAWMAVRRQPLMERDGTLRYGIVAGLLFAVVLPLGSVATGERGVVHMTPLIRSKRDFHIVGHRGEITP